LSISEPQNCKLPSITEPDSEISYAYKKMELRVTLINLASFKIQITLIKAIIKILGLVNKF